eukprot:COSAG05_NODE_1237_length_5434_cov_7.991565_2_plen_564_part_00
MSLDTEPHPLDVGRDHLNYGHSTRDIEYAYPKRSGLVSERHSDPLNPDYRLGQSFKPPPAPANQLQGKRTTERNLLRLDDIEGYAPRPIYDRSRPPKNTLDYSDVAGSTVRATHLGRTGRMRAEPDPFQDSLRVQDINMEGTRAAMAGWQGGRMTNPLEPQYQYDRRDIAPDELLRSTKPQIKGENGSLRTHDIEGAKPFSWNDIWDKLGNKALRTTNFIGDIDGAAPGGLRKRPGADRDVQFQEGENINLLGTWRQSNPLQPAYTRLDGTRPASRDHYRDPSVPAFPFGAAKRAEPKPSRLPPMEGDVFPKMLPPPPEPLGSQELDGKAKTRHEKRVLDMVRDKVEAKSKNMAKVFRQFDENKDGDISYDEFRLGLRHLGIELSDGDYDVLVKKVDVDGEGTVDYNEFAEVLKAPDMQLSFMPTDAPFAGTADVSSMKTDLNKKREVRPLHPPPPAYPSAYISRAVAWYFQFIRFLLGSQGAQGPSKRKQMGLAMLPKDDILRQIAEKVESKSKNMRNVFRAFDEDKSGTVDLIEFRRGVFPPPLHNLSWTPRVYLWGTQAK